MYIWHFISIRNNSRCNTTIKLSWIHSSNLTKNKTEFTYRRLSLTNSQIMLVSSQQPIKCILCHMGPVRVVKIINVWSNYGRSFLTYTCETSSLFMLYFTATPLDTVLLSPHNCSALYWTELRTEKLHDWLTYDFHFYRHITYRENSRTYMGNLILAFFTVGPSVSWTFLMVWGVHAGQVTWSYCTQLLWHCFLLKASYPEQVQDTVAVFSSVPWLSHPRMSLDTVEYIVDLSDHLVRAFQGSCSLGDFLLVRIRWYN
jgi:hypothetical protein